MHPTLVSVVCCISLTQMKERSLLPTLWRSAPRNCLSASTTTQRTRRAVRHRVLSSPVSHLHLGSYRPVFAPRYQTTDPHVPVTGAVSGLQQWLDVVLEYQ